MLKPLPGSIKPYPRVTLGTALTTYLLGCAVFGFLLAMPSPSLPPVAWTGVGIGVFMLSLAGALAPDHSLRGSFLLAVFGAIPLIGTVAWASTLVGAPAFSVAVLSVVFWGLTWAIAEDKEIAGPIAIAFSWIAIVSWVANAAAFLAGVLFMFISSGYPALGESMGDRWDTWPRFWILLLTAGCGLTLGWLGRTGF